MSTDAMPSTESMKFKLPPIDELCHCPGQTIIFVALTFLILITMLSVFLLFVVMQIIFITLFMLLVLIVLLPVMFLAVLLAVTIFSLCKSSRQTIPQTKRKRGCHD